MLVSLTKKLADLKSDIIWKNQPFFWNNVFSAQVFVSLRNRNSMWNGSSIIHTYFHKKPKCRGTDKILIAFLILLFRDVLLCCNCYNILNALQSLCRSLIISLNVCCAISVNFLVFCVHPCEFIFCFVNNWSPFGAPAPFPFALWDQSPWLCFFIGLSLIFASVSFFVSLSLSLELFLLKINKWSCFHDILMMVRWIGATEYVR